MSEFLTKEIEPKKIEKIVEFLRTFDEMSQNQREAWLEEMGDIDIEYFYKANQRVFNEDGPRESSAPRREFFLDLIKNRLKSEPLTQPEGHPIANYLKENIAIRELCDKINAAFDAQNLKSYDESLKLLYELSKIHTLLKKRGPTFSILRKA